MNLTDTTEIYGTLSIDFESPIIIFQQSAKKLVELLSNVKVVNEVAADLVGSYETLSSLSQGGITTTVEESTLH